jgi:hypothetical protein
MIPQMLKNRFPISTRLCLADEVQNIGLKLNGVIQWRDRRNTAHLSVVWTVKITDKSDRSRLSDIMLVIFVSLDF